MARGVVTQHINGGWLIITPEDVTVENDRKEEVVYWHSSEWNEESPGNEEAAVACINAVMAALAGGVPYLYEICPGLKDRPV